MKCRNVLGSGTSFRFELFYHNINKLPATRQAVELPAGQKPISDTNVVQ